MQGFVRAQGSHRRGRQAAAQAAAARPCAPGPRRSRRCSPGAISALKDAAVRLPASREPARAAFGTTATRVPAILATPLRALAVEAVAEGALSIMVKREASPWSSTRIHRTTRVVCGCRRLLLPSGG